MRTIRISDETYEALKKLAEPWKDTQDDVVRRLLGLAPTAKEPPETENGGQGGKRPQRKKGTPQPAFRIPILRALVDLGGKGRTPGVLENVEAQLSGTLDAVDRALVRSGQVRWRNRAAWERQAMVNDGLLKSDSDHGMWEVSDKGRKYLESNGKKRAA